MQELANDVWHTAPGTSRMRPVMVSTPTSLRVDREKFARASGLGIVTSDSAGLITSWNPAAERIFGISRAEALGRPMEIIIPERFRAAHRAGLARVAAGARSSLLGQTVEVTAMKADGSEFPIALSLASWQTRSGIEFGAHVLDISERRSAEERLLRRASHDQLTRLLGNKSFKAQLESLLEKKHRVALVLIDLDGFKAINDSLGHSIGDALLQSLAVRLRAIASPDWIIGRLGGDEFAIALPADADRAQIVQSARGLLSRLSKTFRVGGHQLHVSASIGIALSPDDTADAEEMMALADRAMFQSKRRGGHRVRLFDQTMRAEIAARRSLNDGLRSARVENQWHLFYQPQYDLSSGRLFGAEALLRWRHPEWGLIEPAAFLPVLETHAVSFETGQWVLNETCRQLSEWRKAGFHVPRISCNLFASQLHSQSFQKTVFHALKTHGLQPCDLDLEITEKIALKLDPASLRPLFELVESGVGVALDDFGTGYASLTTLTRAPITQLKIDRSFVGPVVDDPHSSAVVAGMVAISRELGVDLIAEGVEKTAQADKLAALGCNLMQGFMFGMPMQADDFAAIGMRPSGSFP